MNSSSQPSIHRNTLIGLLVSKFLLHLVAVLNGYGLHRDEFLYLAEGSHPMWGYMEGPPIIGWVAGLSRLVFGTSVWAAKFPVLLVGMLSLYLLLKLVTELGGGKRGQIIAGVAWLLSPVFLGSNALFQPVSFNQFCWLLIGLAWVRVVNHERAKDWYILGLVTGLALMTKYSVVFYLLALLVGILLTPQRKLLAGKYLWRAAAIALLMWLPNLAWQFYYDFPVVSHMQELAETQLVNLSLADFLLPQFLFHTAGVFVWIPGLYYLFTAERLRPYRSLAWAYLLLMFLLIALSGKAYYTMGAYTSLMAAGGLFWEEKVGQKSLWLLPVFAVNFLFIPFGLPVLPIDKMQTFGVFIRDEVGLAAPLRWEDGEYRDLSQDYADMHGWEEMVQAVAKEYHQLAPEDKANCFIYGGNYGQAGALSFYRKKYDLPEPVSYNASFILWVPREMTFDRQISVEDYPQPASEFFQRTDTLLVQHSPFARETHYFYYYTEPSSDPAAAWREEIKGRIIDRVGRY
ncbi:glycosyltransferase family 39 protein [Neolewinella agarilytica]|uniref:glycosyltransferase family 39 protein n=1 Tax=Neolewinella agarilytica TaxID=478744 RepID=UPI002355E8C3|nr:glycosyltransferase family 39 protein [Neolewinella agarilytica]